MLHVLEINAGSVVTDIQEVPPPYSESWSGGANPNNMFAGIYDLTVTDQNGCLFILSNVIVDQPLSRLQLNATITDVLPCNGDLTGVIDPFAQGGTAPYSYSVLNNNSLVVYKTDNYTVIVEDANGCLLLQDVFTVDEPAPVSANLTIDSVSCFGLNDGQVTVGPVGGTSYSIALSLLNGNILDTQTASRCLTTTAGEYLLYIEDALGCFITIMLLLTNH